MALGGMARAEDYRSSAEQNKVNMDSQQAHVFLPPAPSPSPGPLFQVMGLLEKAIVGHRELCETLYATLDRAGLVIVRPDPCQQAPAQSPLPIPRFPLGEHLLLFVNALEEASAVIRKLLECLAV